MPQIPNPRRPGQTGNAHGQAKNAAAFNARHKAKKAGSCGLYLIGVGMLAILAAAIGFGLTTLVL